MQDGFFLCRFRKSYCQEVNERLREEDSNGTTSTGGTVASAAISTTPPAATSASSSSLSAEAKKRRTEEAEEVLTRPLPKEVLEKILLLLDSPRDISAAAAVSHGWHDAALGCGHWRHLLPSQWARGQWSFREVRPTEAEVGAILRTFGESSESLVGVGMEEEEEQVLAHTVGKRVGGSLKNSFNFPFPSFLRLPTMKRIPLPPYPTSSPPPAERTSCTFAWPGGFSPWTVWVPPCLNWSYPAVAGSPTPTSGPSSGNAPICAGKKIMAELPSWTKKPCTPVCF